MKKSRIFHNLQRNVEEESTYTFFNYRPPLKMKFWTSKMCTVVKTREGAIRVAICNFFRANMLAYDVHSRVLLLSQEQRLYFCPYLKHEFSAFVKV